VSGTDGQENRTHIRETGQSFQANEIAGLKISNMYDMEQTGSNQVSSSRRNMILSQNTPPLAVKDDTFKYSWNDPNKRDRS